jgi:phosphoglycolate phosphatase-like HAD superfamily hydrolase
MIGPDPRKLAVFDVDGTLLDNMECEDACYSAALRETLGLSWVDTDWSGYEHVSDAAIAVEAFRREFGAEPTAEQLDATISRFVRLLGDAHRADPGAIVPVPGARELLESLESRGWAVALATGAWRRAAELKLSGGGVRYADLPLATSEDGPARTQIVTTARSRAERRHVVERFERVVCIGDGVWDVWAARDLELPFVGVGTGARAERLAAAGARVIVADFVDIDATVAAFETAPSPGGSDSRRVRDHLTEKSGIPRPITSNRNQ